MQEEQQHVRAPPDMVYAVKWAVQQMFRCGAVEGIPQRGMLAVLLATAVDVLPCETSDR